METQKKLKLIAYLLAIASLLVFVLPFYISSQTALWVTGLGIIFDTQAGGYYASKTQRMVFLGSVFFSIIYIIATWLNLYRDKEIITFQFNIINVIILLSFDCGLFTFGVFLLVAIFLASAIIEIYRLAVNSLL